MIHVLISAATIICAILAVRASRLLVSALWLAATSALVALEMYLLGAPEIAVIELSVGAGLVTILFVFAINLTGEENFDARRMVPRPLAWVLLAIAGLILFYMIWPEIDHITAGSMQGTFREIFWENRKLDTLLQLLMIFCGVLGVLGLLQEERKEKVLPTKERGT
ncbi:MAG: NADH-quinone oxidoreductase subunit J [Bellilinea sp.]